MHSVISSACYVMFFHSSDWDLDFPTCDVFAELIVRLLQCLHQLWDTALLNQGYLVVHVLIDEVACGAGSETLHFLVLTVEQLHQLTNALQATHLQTGWD